MITFSFTNGVLEMYRDDVQFISQPSWPNGTEWASEDEATAWANAFIAAGEDAAAPYPANGPDEEPLPKAPARPEEKDGFVIVWDIDTLSYIYEPVPVEEEANA